MSDILRAAAERAYELSYAGQARFDSAVTWAAMSRTAKAFAKYIAEASEKAQLFQQFIKEPTDDAYDTALAAAESLILSAETDDLTSAVEEAFARLPPMFQGKTMAENVAKVFAERGLKIVRAEP